jgi:hypothetical protein
MDEYDSTHKTQPRTVVVAQRDADHALIGSAHGAELHPAVELPEGGAGDLHGAAIQVGRTGEDSLS